MRLEDLRNENLGMTYVHMSNGHDVRCAYVEYVANAYRNTTQMLLLMENTKTLFTLRNDIRYVAIVGMWFLSVESYIHSILKILSELKGIDTNKLKIQELDLSGKITKIFEVAEVDRKEFYKQGIFTELNEFMSFRNFIFHDNHTGKKLKIKHTMFHNDPITCNMIDVMQAIKISVRIFEAFRYIIPHYDLMPNAMPAYCDFEKYPAYYEKFDRIYLELLKPYFNLILNKHMLSTDFNFEYICYNLPTSKVFDDVNMIPTIKAIPNIKDIRINEIDTKFYSFCLTNLTENIFVPKDMFRVPDWRKI